MWPLDMADGRGGPMAFNKINKITLGIVAALVLATVGAAMYRAAAATDVDALGAAIAELRHAQRLAAEWTGAADQGTKGATVATDGSAFDWRLLRPFGARWQERKGALERTARSLDVPSSLENKLAAYINALDAHAKGVRRFAASDEAATGAPAAAWLTRATTDNLGARADALVGDLDALAESKRAMAVRLEGGAVFAAIGLVAAWILLTVSSKGAPALGVGGAPPPGSNTRPAPRRHGRPSARAHAPPAHVAETRRLREAMVAQLVAERLQAAAQRIRAAVPKLLHAPATARLASQMDDEAHDVAVVAASFAGLSRRGAPQPALVSVAACLDDVIADTDIRGVPVSWRGAGAQDAGADVFALPAAIRLMFANLLENATHAVCLAHQRPTDGGRIAVYCAIENDRVVVTVTDNGIGMSAAQRERAFFPFCSGWPANGPAPSAGMGCGLAMTAKLVEACGGTIALGSPPEGGTVAQIKLPLAMYVRRQAPSASANPPVGNPQPAPARPANGHATPLVAT